MLELARALATTELDDNLHLGRMLLLLSAYAGKGVKPIEGFTKLAKLDFLLRYPNCLERALKAEGKATSDAKIQDFERTTIESKMVRFRFGPWDHRYRRWVALLVARGLVTVSLDKRTVKVGLTDTGRALASIVADTDAHAELAERAKLVTKAFGSKGGTALKEFVYATFPEITDMKWGEEISI